MLIESDRYTFIFFIRYFEAILNFFSAKKSESFVLIFPAPFYVVKMEVFFSFSNVICGPLLNMNLWYWYLYRISIEIFQALMSVFFVKEEKTLQYWLRHSWKRILKEYYIENWKIHPKPLQEMKISLFHLPTGSIRLIQMQSKYRGPSMRCCVWWLSTPRRPFLSRLELWNGLKFFSKFYFTSRFLTLAEKCVFDLFMWILQ